MSPPSDRVLVLGSGYFDTLSGELSIDGGSIRLRPRTAMVLAQLLRNADRLVTKDELMQAVWPDAVVTEDSLVQCIKEIRHALGVMHHDWIRTFPRQGYAFIAATDAASGKAPLDPSAWRSLALTAPDAARSRNHDARLLDLMLCGWQFFSTYTAEGHARARAVYEKVIALAPNHVEAITLLGWTHWFDAISGWSADPDASDRKAAELAEWALDCGGGIAPPHGLMGKVLLWRARHAEALTHLERAAALAPTYAYMLFHLGDALVWCGRPDDSLEYLDRALTLSPNDSGVFLTIRGIAQWMAGDAGHARDTLESALRRNPSYPWAHGMLAVVLHEGGDHAYARSEAAAGHRFNRRFSIHFAEHAMPFLLPEHRHRVAAAWRAAGLQADESPPRGDPPGPGRRQACGLDTPALRAQPSAEQPFVG